MEKYISLLIEQFKQATGIKNVDINSQSFMLEFSEWIKSRHSISNNYLDLLEYLIRTYSNKGDVVLDNCMGSGSTGVACVNTDRRFIGIELNDEYYHIADNRIWEAYKGETK